MSAEAQINCLMKSYTPVFHHILKLKIQIKFTPGNSLSQVYFQGMLTGRCGEANLAIETTVFKLSCKFCNLTG